MSRISSRGTKLDQRFTATTSEDMMEKLKAKAEDEGVEMATLMRRAFAAYLDPASSPNAPDGEPVDVYQRFLTKAPCGPWEEAIEQSNWFALSRDVGEELGAREGDVIVRTIGDSMSEAGIPDGALLLMRPLANNRPPRAGKVALVQIVDSDNAYLGTIKRWVGDGKLVDGADRPFSPPKNTQEIKPVAEAIGMITLL